MQKIKETSTYTPEKTRELLIQAAKILFAKQGFEATTVKELSDHAGVNVSLVSYHFGGKEGLYRACLDQFGRAHLDVTQRLLIKTQSLEEFKVRLQMFISEMIQTAVAEPELVRMIHRECERDLPVIEDLFLKTFFKVYETLVTFIQHAQKQGFVRKQIDAQVAASFLFGGLTSFSKNDLLSKKFFNRSIRDEKYRKKVVEDIYEMFMCGLTN